MKAKRPFWVRVQGFVGECRKIICPRSEDEIWRALGIALPLAVMFITITGVLIIIGIAVDVYR